MIRMQGKGVSKGVVHGPVCFFRRPELMVKKTAAADTEQEKARIDEARRRSRQQLEAMAERCGREADEETAAVFMVHAMCVDDCDYLACIEDVLKTEKCCAEYAVWQAGERMSALLASSDDAYLRARTADIRDVTWRILRNLSGTADGRIELKRPVILAADDLTPSETVQFDKSQILGFLMRGGSANSHTAILARTMGIPAICGLGDALPAGCGGRECWMDGETGEAVLDPDEETMGAMKAKQEKQAVTRELLRSMRGKADVTMDGRRLPVFCNISSVEDLDAVRDCDGQGIGLFRSEFLYLRSADCPTEEEQFGAYRTVAAAMEGKPVVIRTLDIGADKQVPYLDLPAEANPAMGLRAVRICLSRPEIFRTQLRAIYRASAFGDISILFPMIASLWEVKECRRICGEVMAELDREGVAYRRETKLGVMIETPAAALIADQLAEEADFFSVGTNDLTQYILACDRQSGGLERFFDPHHPAVLRALRMTADAAHKAGIPVGVCGDLAGDVSLLDTFLEMGIGALSVPPSSVLALRSAIRGRNLAGGTPLRPRSGPAGT